jgi:exodeoxyribonuclease V alpha subunit
MYNPKKTDIPAERLAGSVERITFHSEESGFCIFRVKVKGRRDLVTIVGSAASITPGEYVEGLGHGGKEPEVQQKADESYRKNISCIGKRRRYFSTGKPYLLRALSIMH